MKEDEITRYYIDFIVDIFVNLNIDERIKIIEHMSIRAKYYNIRRIITYKNNLRCCEYEKYYNKKLGL